MLTCSPRPGNKGLEATLTLQAYGPLFHRQQHALVAGLFDGQHQIVLIYVLGPFAQLFVVVVIVQRLVFMPGQFIGQL